MQPCQSGCVFVQQLNNGYPTQVCRVCNTTALTHWEEFNEELDNHMWNKKSYQILFTLKYIQMYHKKAFAYVKPHLAIINNVNQSLLPTSKFAVDITTRAWNETMDCVSLPFAILSPRHVNRIMAVIHKNTQSSERLVFLFLCGILFSSRVYLVPSLDLLTILRGLTTGSGAHYICEVEAIKDYVTKPLVNEIHAQTLWAEKNFDFQNVGQSKVYKLVAPLINTEKQATILPILQSLLVKDLAMIIMHYSWL